MTEPSTPEIGQYYAPTDHAGVLRRLVILIVDSGVLLLVAVPLFVLAVGEPSLRLVAFNAWLAFAYVYLVLIERTSIGTLGFLLTGVKIVTLKGDRPSLLKMTFRLLLWVLGPIHPIVDLYWMTGDDSRQTMRDKFAGTIVVRKSATPAGTGEIRLNRYQFLGLSFVFYEVQRPPAAIKAT